MNSMTGYGRAEGVCGACSVSVEVASFNRKGKEISISLPRDLQVLERMIAEVFRNRFQRGKFQVQVQFKPFEDGVHSSWKAARVHEVLQQLGALAEANSIAFKPDAHLLLRVAQMVGEESGLPASKMAAVVLEPLVNEAANALEGMRSDEGAALCKDLKERIEMMCRHVEQVRDLAKDTVGLYREALLERLRQVGLELDLNDERVLREIALFADRADVSEELTRLTSHLDQFVESFREKEAVGRKLDFLCQELNREVNTIASKANQLEITRVVIEMKNEIERIREQVQNVE